MGGDLNELEVDAQINQATLLNTELLNKQMQQNFEIQEKEKLLYTRNRMLQLSYEENMFKKKILYCLLAILLLFVVIGVVGMLKVKNKK
jgi:hypothetical protein